MRIRKRRTFLLRTHHPLRLHMRHRLRPRRRPRAANLVTRSFGVRATARSDTPSRSIRCNLRMTDMRRRSLQRTQRRFLRLSTLRVPSSPSSGCLGRHLHLKPMLTRPSLRLTRPNPKPRRTPLTLQRARSPCRLLRMKSHRSPPERGARPFGSRHQRS
jgi:hypothetical protein